MGYTWIYPPVFKHGLLDNPPFVVDFPIYEGFPSQPWLIAKRYTLRCNQRKTWL
jgi:hypothetical protein